MARKNSLPVVDGDGGAVDSYGRASTRRGAMRVASFSFADPVVDARIVENVTLSNGTVLPRAWMAVTEYGAEG